MRFINWKKLKLVSCILLWLLISHECESLLLLKRDSIALDKSPLKLFDHRKNTRRTSAIDLTVSSGSFLPEDDAEQTAKPRPVLEQPPITDTGKQLMFHNHLAVDTLCSYCATYD
jgi:hypothetical protein